MNKTKKAIIEIIEPFMDKTLSEGCYIKVWENSCDICSSNEYCWHKQNYEYSKIQEDNTFKVNLDRYTMEDFNQIYTWYKTPTYWCKILWHFDITSVEKYIQEKWCIRSDSYDCNWIFYNQPWRWWLCIPNKPLSIYSEIEEKELLDLLIKISS